MKPTIRERRHVCGRTLAEARYMEVDIYPISDRAYDRAMTAPRRLPTRKAQANLNDKNARRHLVQLLNTNFDGGDLFVTCTYRPGMEPADDDQARRDITNYVRRLAAANRKRGGEPLKYIIVTEKGTRNGRVHHHMVIRCGLDRDEIEALWTRKGEKLGTCNAKRLQFEDGSIEQLANYLRKEAGRKRRWKQSRNLEQPKHPRPADHKYTRREVERIALDGNTRLHNPEFWAKKFPGWELNRDGAEAVWNECTGGWYIYLKLHRKRGGTP